MNYHKKGVLIYLPYISVAIRPKKQLSVSSDNFFYRTTISQLQIWEHCIKDLY